MRVIKSTVARTCAICERTLLQGGELLIIEAHHTPQLGRTERQAALVAMPDQAPFLFTELLQQPGQRRPLGIVLVGAVLLRAEPLCGLIQQGRAICAVPMAGGSIEGGGVGELPLLQQGTELVGALQNLQFSADELAAIDRHAVDGGINLWKKPSTDQRL